MKKKLLSLALALALCLSLLPAALAAGSKTYYCAAGSLVEEADGFYDYEITGANVTNRDGDEGFAYLPWPDDGQEWSGKGEQVPIVFAQGPVTLRLAKGSKAGEQIDYTAVNWLNVNIMAYNASTGLYDVQKYNTPVFNGQAALVSSFNDEGEATAVGEPITIQEMFNRWDNDADDFYAIYQGASVTLSEPGTYCVETGYGDLMGLEKFLVIVSAAAAAGPAQTGSASAVPTNSTVLVNGQSVAFDAYNIGGSNYFKLRDLASVLSGTAKQFEVSYDKAANAIALTSGASYTPVGGEMTAGTAGTKTAAPTSSKILLDGKEVSFDAYNIGGNNYFKLRDIGQTFNFGVGWDSASRTITIDTSAAYTA